MQKTNQKALLEELRKQSNKTLNNFTNFFLEVQNNRRANYKEALEIFKNQKEDEIFCFSMAV